MIYSSLDLSRQDESNDSKIIQIGAIFAEIAIFAKFQVGSGRVNCLTRPEFSGRVGSGTRISGQKCGALASLLIGLLPLYGLLTETGWNLPVIFSLILLDLAKALKPATANGRAVSLIFLNSKFSII